MELINWADVAVVLIILGFAVIGVLNGFIYSIFKIASFFISIFLAITFYPLLSAFLMKTPLYDSINAAILRGFLARQAENSSVVAGSGFSEGVLNSLDIPEFLKQPLKNGIPDFSKMIDLRSILESLSAGMTKMIIVVISVVILFIVIRVGMIFAKNLLKGLAKIPVFKQIDKFSGFLLGAVEGVLTVFVVCTVLVFMNASASHPALAQQIGASYIASWFYNNNFILNIIFPN